MLLGATETNDCFDRLSGQGSCCNDILKKRYFCLVSFYLPSYYLIHLSFEFLRILK